jgi:hypothetical protein
MVVRVRVPRAVVMHVLVLESVMVVMFVVRGIVARVAVVVPVRVSVHGPVGVHVRVLVLAFDPGLAASAAAGGAHVWVLSSVRVRGRASGRRR